MRGTEGAHRAVTEALKELTLCGYVWAFPSLLLTLSSLDPWNILGGQKVLLSTTELVGKLA